MSNIADEVTTPKRRGRPRKNIPQPPDLSEENVQKLVERRKNAQGLPNIIEGSSTPSEISGMLNAVMRWYNSPPVRTDEECAARLTDFFDVLAKKGELPSVEKMALALGVTRATIWNWENGVFCSPTRQAMIRQAKEMLAAMDAELVNHNKIPQVTYIFRAKNFFGMKDQTDVVVTPNNPIGAEVPEEELRKRIMSDVIVDESLLDT